MQIDIRIVSKSIIGIVIACLSGAISPVGAGFASATPPSYAISETGGPVVNGSVVDIDGVAQARPYVGQINQQDVSIDWDDDQNPDTFMWVPATSFTITSSGGSGGNKFFFGDWTGSHTYASSGTYTVRACPSPAHQWS
jgi:hypothetical protein